MNRNLLKSDAGEVKRIENVLQDWYSKYLGKVESGQDTITHKQGFGVGPAGEITYGETEQVGLGVDTSRAGIGQFGIGYTPNVNIFDEGSLLAGMGQARGLTDLPPPGTLPEFTPGMFKKLRTEHYQSDIEEGRGSLLSDLVERTKRASAKGTDYQDMEEEKQVNYQHKKDI